MRTTPPAHDEAVNVTIQDPRERRAILAAVCIALMAVTASVTGLNVAQPQIALELGASQGQVLWMINIYAASLAALLLPLGAAGDRWGRKTMLLLGLLLFGAANVTASLAASTEVMLISRFFSGSGAAMIMPVTLAVITSGFPDEERGQAIGIWTAVAGGGGLLGMLLSAILVDTAGWRALFILPVVLVLIAGYQTGRVVPNSREIVTHEFDIAGSLASVVAVGGLIVFLHEGPERGWTAPATILSLLIGIGGGIGFVIWERRVQAPLLELALFRDRGLASGSLVILAGFGVQAGIIVILYPYLQAVLGWSGLLATLALMPMAVLMMLASGLAPRLSFRLGARLTMASGVILSGLGLALMALRVSVDGGYRSILPGILIMGLGVGLTMTPATEAITSSLPRERQGVASALNDVTRELGTALGVALLGALFTAGYVDAITPHLAGLPEPSADMARKGIASALVAAGEAGLGAHALTRAAQEAFVHGWQQGILAGVLAMAVLLIVVLLRGPQSRRAGTPAASVGSPGWKSSGATSPRVQRKEFS